MNLSRTDLAVETAEALPTGRDMFAPGTGVTKSECLLCGCPVTRIHVHTPAGARAIGKPEGRYITIDLRPALSRQEALTGRAALCLCRELRALLPPPSDGPALVVGLGNDAMTPDAVGAAALEHLLVTRHMVRSMPRQFGALTPVAALATGVLARTGVETLELIRGAADRLHPSVVIAIDALAARSRHRLCATVQLGDTGLIPGSGVGNHRKAVNARTLGGIRSKADYAAILDRIGEALGDARARQFHVHFSRIEYSKGGEKRHWTFAETQFGPEPQPLMELLAERGLAPVIICESAGTQAEDAKTMKRFFEACLCTTSQSACARQLLL